MTPRRAEKLRFSGQPSYGLRRLRPRSFCSRSGTAQSSARRRQSLGSTVAELAEITGIDSSNVSRRYDVATRRLQPRLGLIRPCHQDHRNLQRTRHKKTAIGPAPFPTRFRAHQCQLPQFPTRTRCPILVLKTRAGSPPIKTVTLGRGAFRSAIANTNFSESKTLRSLDLIAANRRSLWIGLSPAPAVATMKILGEVSIPSLTQTERSASFSSQLFAVVTI